MGDRKIKNKIINNEKRELIENIDKINLRWDLVNPKDYIHNFEKKKSISKKYASCVHVGIKRAMNEFPIIKQIIFQNPEISKELKLSKEEMDYLEGK